MISRIKTVHKVLYKNFTSFQLATTFNRWVGRCNIELLGPLTSTKYPQLKKQTLSGIKKLVWSTNINEVSVALRSFENRKTNRCEKSMWKTVEFIKTTCFEGVAFNSKSSYYFEEMCCYFQWSVFPTKARKFFFDWGTVFFTGCKKMWNGMCWYKETVSKLPVVVDLSRR